MKTKMILIVALAATLGGAAGWLSPHPFGINERRRQ